MSFVSRIERSPAGDYAFLTVDENVVDPVTGLKSSSKFDVDDFRNEVDLLLTENRTKSKRCIDWLQTEINLILSFVSEPFSFIKEMLLNFLSYEIKHLKKHSYTTMIGFTERPASTDLPMHFFLKLIEYVLDERNNTDKELELKECLNIMVSMLREPEMLYGKFVKYKLVKVGTRGKRAVSIEKSKVKRKINPGKYETLLYSSGFLLYYFIKNDFLSQDFAVDKFLKIVEKINKKWYGSNFKRGLRLENLVSKMAEVEYDCFNKLLEDLINSKFTLENLKFSDELIEKIVILFMDLFKCKHFKRLFTIKQRDEIKNLLVFEPINSRDVPIAIKKLILFLWIQMSKKRFWEDEFRKGEIVGYSEKFPRERPKYFYEGIEDKKGTKDICFLDEMLEYLIKNDQATGHFLFDFTKHSNKVLKDYVVFFKWLKQINECYRFPELYSRLDELLEEAENELYSDKRRFSPEVLDEKERIKFCLESKEELGLKKFQVRLFNGKLDAGFFVQI